MPANARLGIVRSFQWHLSPPNLPRPSISESLEPPIQSQVRTAAAFKVTGFCERISVEVTLQHLMPCARDLAVDSSQHVRAALASVTEPHALYLSTS